MKKKIICAVLTGVIAATCAAITPVIKIDMSWKKDLNRAVANIKPSDITIPNFTIPDAYFKNIKIGG